MFQDAILSERRLQKTRPYFVPSVICSGRKSGELLLWGVTSYSLLLKDCASSPPTQDANSWTCSYPYSLPTPTPDWPQNRRAGVKPLGACLQPCSPPVILQPDRATCLKCKSGQVSSCLKHLPRLPTAYGPERPGPASCPAPSSSLHLGPASTSVLGFSHA